MNSANHSARPRAEQIESIFDGARAVVTDQELMAVAVWTGGATINVYGMETLQPRTCFSITDEKGEALEREAIVEHIDEVFEREKENMFGENRE